MLFVFPAEHTALANKVFHGLRNGNNHFPGMAGMFGIKITNESVLRSPKFNIQGLTRSAAAAAYAQAINTFLAEGGRADFALVICEKTLHDEHPSPYYAAKSILAAHGIPSQTITVDLLAKENQLAWSLGNIALQIFVKLGGHPWHVKPSPGGGDVVIGIGRSERIDRTGNLQRVVGFSTCYTAGGVFRSVEVFRPHSSFTDYLDDFEESVKEALRHSLASESPLRLVLHVPKRFSRAEQRKLEAVLAGMPDRIAGYVVLRVSDDHPFLMFDLAHATYAPRSGIDLELDSRNRLLLLEGRPDEGNMRKSPPGPLWVTLQKASTTDVSLDALVQQIYDLAVANWRGFNARARPITTHYAKLIADILSATEGDDLVQSISDSSVLRNVPWFI